MSLNTNQHSAKSQLTSVHHPLDPLNQYEIRTAASIFRQKFSSEKIRFNCITLLEPPKHELLAYLSTGTGRPARMAEVIALDYGKLSVTEAIIDINQAVIVKHNIYEDVHPTITVDDLRDTESIVRQDVGVIEACRGLGITDMSKVYCDGWTIGYDERWGKSKRLQQGLMYYRPTPTSNQYAHPLDFCPIIDMAAGKVIHIDFRTPQKGSKYERAPVPMTPYNYLPEFSDEFGGYRKDVKKIATTQPQGVSFKMNGNEIEWLSWKMHIGFNFREGIVLSNVRYNDNGVDRPIFWRMSISEMVVPYGAPIKPHQRKHAFDVGEYGMGFNSHSLKLGCDCKGSIHYLDGVVNNKDGKPEVIKNAICIHEEDSGLLFKHLDFRDNSYIATRARKLIISQIFTAANYEYCIYWQFFQDGNIQPELKLTGILNTYVLAPDEKAAPYGTEVAPYVTAHNHQHIFCLRLDPMVDGLKNTVVQNDATSTEAAVGSEENYYGNGFYCKKTPLTTTDMAQVNYNHDTSRSWDIISSSSKHPVSKAPTAYKIVNLQMTSILAKEGSLVWKRAGFARNHLFVTPYAENRLYPAGKFVPQTHGEKNPINENILDWSAGSQNIANTDIIVWVNLGLTHFPRPEDFPVMPTESASMLLRPSHFFLKNPALNVPPSTVFKDESSTFAFADKNDTQHKL